VLQEGQCLPLGAGDSCAFGGLALTFWSCVGQWFIHHLLALKLSLQCESQDGRGDWKQPCWVYFLMHMEKVHFENQLVYSIFSLLISRSSRVSKAMSYFQILSSFSYAANNALTSGGGRWRCARATCLSNLCNHKIIQLVSQVES
jgi:hypothetical protein